MKENQKKIAGYFKNNPQIENISRIIIESGKDLHGEIEEQLAENAVKGLLFWPRIVFPFSDDVERKKFPLVTISLMVTSALLYLSQVLFDPYWILETWDLLPENFKEAYNFDMLATIFSQGGLPHLIWNMLFLWLFGDNVEDRFSRLGYLMFFVFCGVMSLIIYSMMINDLPVSAIGIGGAVSAVMGAYLIFYPTAKLKFFVAGGVLEVPVVICLAIWFIFQLLNPYIFKTQASLASICFSHVSGFIFGVIIASVKKVKAEE